MAALGAGGGWRVVALAFVVGGPVERRNDGGGVMGDPPIALNNAQEAPFPTALDELVASCAYRPGWRVWLADEERGQGSKGLTLVVLAVTPDSYAPHADIRVRHLFPVPPAAYDRASWQRWLFEQFLLVERHECMEFFTIDGVKSYAPNHGPGHDPYVVRELTSDRARRTNFRGEVGD